MKFLATVFAVCLCFKFGFATTRLKVAGSGFSFGGSAVYLSGLNQAWHYYAHDFGNHNYHHSHPPLETILQEIHDAGGNSIRIWLHIDSQFTPKFNNLGNVAAADDYCNHVIKELRGYLCAAQELDIFVFFVLWNGAKWNTVSGPQLNGLITVDEKLQSYIDNALIPIVNALRGFPSLGGYDIMNEPEGIVIVETDPKTNPCEDTLVLQGSGAGWETDDCLSGSCFFMHRLQRFINWQAAAIKQHDPDALVTVGSWRENAQNSISPNSYNFYSNTCLRQAGLRFHGVLDFYQIHTYADHIGVAYSAFSPMERTYPYYGLDKPLVIGEYSSTAGDGRSNAALAEYAFDNGYAGAWSWHAKGGDDYSDSLSAQLLGLLSLSTEPEVSSNLGTCNLSGIQKNDAIRAKPLFFLGRFCRQRALPQVVGLFNG